MIIGIGADILEIPRIERLMEMYGEKFINRVFNEEERGTNPAHYAKRFAGKEAIAKAFGTGIGKLAFKDIVITKSESGQPLAEIKGLEGVKIHVSLSDEYPYAFAMALAEKLD